MSDIKERYLVTIDGTEFDLNLSRQDDGCLVEFNGDKYRVNFDRLSGQQYLFKMNESSSEVNITIDNGTLSLFLDGQEVTALVEPYNLAELRKKTGAAGERQGDKIIRAPMPGLILKVEVEAGERVKKGATLGIVEAMKMENIIKVPFPGNIKEVYVSAGQAVDKNDKLVELE